MMRSWVQRKVRQYGIEIRKAPYPKFEPVSVFDLALHYLIATRGEQQTFIEIGANDGVSSSDPLREFILKYHWKGILVEPQPAVFEKLKANYAGHDDGLVFENVAISKNPEPIPLYRLSANSPSSVASSNPKITAKQLQVKPHELEKIMVPTTRLDDLVAKYGMTDLDILQLDTEGFDWEVLQTLDLTKTRPRMIGYEHGHLSPAAIGTMTQYLNSHGYRVHFGGYETDSVALRDDFYPQALNN